MKFFVLLDEFSDILSACLRKLEHPYSALAWVILTDFNNSYRTYQTLMNANEVLKSFSQSENGIENLSKSSEVLKKLKQVWKGVSMTTSGEQINMQ